MKLKNLGVPFAISIVLGISGYAVLGGPWYQWLVAVWLANAPVTLAWNYLVSARESARPDAERS